MSNTLCKEKTKTIKLEVNKEAKHFFGGDNQFTISIESELWPEIQSVANFRANKNNWLNGQGNDYDYLNILMVGLFANLSYDKNRETYIKQTIEKEINNYQQEFVKILEDILDELEFDIFYFLKATIVNTQHI